MLKLYLSVAIVFLALLGLSACSNDGGLNLEFEDLSAKNKHALRSKAKANHAARLRANRAKRPHRKHVAQKRRHAKNKYRPRPRYNKHAKRRVARNSRRPQRQTATGPFAYKLSAAALGRLRSKVQYDGSYYKMSYPGGDVPANIGVCTDVVIRSYRKLGIDLQQKVHKDMKASFSSYPNYRKWGLNKPDTNIDHRRVVNLRKYFSRRGASLPVTRNPLHYKVGDIVTWHVPPGKSPHIGIVVNKASRADPRRKMIVHNINNGPELDDILFAYPITGHYRYTRANM